MEAANVDDRAEESGRFIVVGCYTGVQDALDGKTWHTFSKDGKFSRDRNFIAVTGFSPKNNICYEMAVRYESGERYCYYIQHSNVPRPNIPGHCSGWTQYTREFSLVDKDAWRAISKAEWNRDYKDKYAR
ncbi:MAG: hypothetical protein OXI54_10200 [Chloroflexota bacterium]|nr:hypothetical protein [Chloroflexota bacterium]